MATKAEIVEKIEEILRVELDSLERMTKDDLEKLLEVLENPGDLIQIGIKNLRARARKEILERPLKDFLERPIIEDIAGKEGGIFGFGVLPRILGRRTKTRKD